MNKKYPYYVVVLNWNGRLTKLNNKKFINIDDATNCIINIIKKYPDIDSNYCKDIVSEYKYTNQLIIMKYNEKKTDFCLSMGFTTIVRILDSNGNIIYKNE